MRTLLLILALWSGRAWSACQIIAFDAASSSTGTGTTLTFSHTTGVLTSGVIVVGVQIYPGTATVTGITYNGAALTQAVAATSTTSQMRSEIWYRLAPSSGANNVVVTVSGQAEVVAGAATYSNVSALGNTASTSSVSLNSIALRFTSSTTQSIIVSSVGQDKVATTFTGGTGLATRWSRTGVSYLSAVGADRFTYNVLVNDIKFTMNQSGENSLVCAEFVPLCNITNTLTPSTSPTPTGTFTYSPTKSPTSSITQTATPSSTFTPTISPTWTLSWTPSNTPTGTPSFSASPTPNLGRFLTDANGATYTPAPTSTPIPNQAQTAISILMAGPTPNCTSASFTSATSATAYDLRGYRSVEIQMTANSTSGGSVSFAIGTNNSTWFSRLRSTTFSQAGTTMGNSSINFNSTVGDGMIIELGGSDYVQITSSISGAGTMTFNICPHYLPMSMVVGSELLNNADLDAVSSRPKTGILNRGQILLWDPVNANRNRVLPGRLDTETYGNDLRLGVADNIRAWQGTTVATAEVPGVPKFDQYNTNTPTGTPTRTITLTPTQTQTFTLSPTLTQTFTFSPTAPGTFTFTPTLTQTPAAYPVWSNSGRLGLDDNMVGPANIYLFKGSATENYEILGVRLFFYHTDANQVNTITYREFAFMTATAADTFSAVTSQVQNKLDTAQAASTATSWVQNNAPYANGSALFIDSFMVPITYYGTTLAAPSQPATYFWKPSTPKGIYVRGANQYFTIRYVGAQGGVPAGFGMIFSILYTRVPDGQ